MSFIDTVNREYEKMVGETDPVAQLKILTEKMWEKGMFMEMHGKKHPFPTFLKPYFVDMRHRDLISRHTRNIIRGVEKVGKLFLDGYNFEGLVHQEGLIAELSRVDPVYPSFQVMVRLDCFYHPESGEMKFLEFNCGDPSGMGWHDAMLDIFMAMPAIKKLCERFDVHTDHLLESHLNAMLKKYREFCEVKGFPAKENPVFAIVCWKESTIITDVLEIVETYKRRGYTAVFADPADFKYDGEHVTVNGTLIDAVYRDAIDDFIKPEFWPHCQDIISAYRDGNICFVNPVRAATGDFKTLPAIMSDEKYRKLFTEEEWQTMLETVPWTRLIRPGEKVNYMGETAEITELMKGNKDAFVLKPNVGYGGFGIFIGLDCSQNDWNNAVDKAAQPGADCAVQEFVRIPLDTFPVVENDQYLGFQPRKVNINYWSHAGEFAGAFLRAAVGNIINVHQGGGLVPVFFLSEKH
ncbi:hypothetical protein JXA40_12260 [bacterium]|nr:hypothetical protein [candidate division CSSED10-310 bacterium]